MKTLRAFAVLAVALAAAAPALAAGKIAGDESLALVPVDAASVAVVRFDELRTSPLAGKLFHDADHLGTSGDAARFMEEAGLKPREDVDAVVLVGIAPPAGTQSDAFAAFEGRFDPDRLASAAASRGATRVAGSTGDYWLLPDKSNPASGGRRTAVAFVSPRLLIAGTEPAVVGALSTRASGGSTFLSGGGLGRQLSRVDRGSSVWALVDVTRYPAIQKGMRSHGGDGGSDASGALMSAMKSVTLFSFQASVRADDLTLSASGVSPDADTRQLLEDSLRGVIAMWRLAVQEKSPDVVAVLRKFKIDSDGDAVTVSGTLPGSVLRSLAEKHTAAHVSIH